jgi:hypothetical protein
MPALMQLYVRRGTRPDATQALTVARVVNQLRAQAGVFQQIQTALVAKYGAEDDKGVRRIPPGSEAQSAYQLEVGSYLDQEVVLQVEPVQVTAEDLAAFEVEKPGGLALIVPFVELE